MNVPDALAAGQFTVYALIDPDDQLIHYVGQTCNPQKRLVDHLSRWPLQVAKTIWIESLKERGKRPIMQTLEVVPSRRIALEREKAWIDHFLQKGMPLVNVTDKGIISIQHAIKPIHQERAVICGCPVRRVWLSDGRTAIILKALLKYFSLSNGSASIHIRSDPVISKYLVYIQTDTRGGPQISKALVEGILPLWIAGLKSIDLPAEKLALINAYQQHSADALCQYFSKISRRGDI